MPLVGVGCKLRGCKPVEPRVWSPGIVVDPPSFGDPAGFSETGEQMFVKEGEEARIAHVRVQVFGIHNSFVSLFWTTVRYSASQLSKSGNTSQGQAFGKQPPNLCTDITDRAGQLCSDYCSGW